MEKLSCAKANHFPGDDRQQGPLLAEDPLKDPLAAWPVLTPEMNFSFLSQSQNDHQLSIIFINMDVFVLLHLLEYQCSSSDSVS